MSKNKGWIKLHRNIVDHWIYQEKPFPKFQAWMDLCMMANHEDRKILLGNELVEVQRGSFITSELKLMNRWGWSKTKVRNFLELLESDNMLIKKADTKKTTLTIVNYSDYQDMKTTEEPEKDQERTTIEPPKNYEETTKRHKQELKNYKEDIYILSDNENRFLATLSDIENYPLDRKRDLDMYQSLEERYPALNLVEAIEQWRIYKLDQPLKPKSNPRSQINTAFKKYVEWGKCLKKGDVSIGQYRTNSKGASEETLRLERIAKEQGLIGADGTIEGPGEVDF